MNSEPVRVGKGADDRILGRAEPWFQSHHLDLLFQNTLVRVWYRVLELAGAEYQMLFREGSVSNTR